LVAQLQEPFAPAAVAANLVRCRNATRAAIAVADPADPDEVELALHVAAPRQYLPRHREKHGLGTEAVAGPQFIAARRKVETDAPRLLARSEARQRIGRDDDAPAAVEQIDIDDAPGQRDRPDTALQHRRAALPPRLLHDREPGGAKGEHDRGVAQHRP